MMAKEYEPYYHPPPEIKAEEYGPYYRRGNPPPRIKALLAEFERCLAAAVREMSKDQFMKFMETVYGLEKGGSDDKGKDQDDRGVA